MSKSTPFLALTFFLIFLISASAEGAETFTVEISAPSYAYPGEEFTVEITVEDPGNVLDELELTIYDAAGSLYRAVNIDVITGQGEYTHTFPSDTFSSDALGEIFRLEIAGTANGETDSDSAYVAVIKKFGGFGIPETNLLFLPLIGIIVLIVLKFKK